VQFHKDGNLPTDEDSIWVFGSNLAGIHGAGAAEVAFEKFSASWAQGVGLSGRSYAIPTKDHNLKTLPLKDIGPYIREFVAFTRKYCDSKFFVTRVGCGLAGFRNETIAPLFKNCGDNCNMPIGWKKFLEER